MTVTCRVLTVTLEYMTLEFITMRGTLKIDELFDVAYYSLMRYGYQLVMICYE